MELTLAPECTSNTLGRPSLYSKELAKSFCDQLTLGRSVRQICKMDGMPAMSQIFAWLRDKPDFQEQYSQARELQAEALADELLDIADDGSNDFMEVLDKQGKAVGWKENGESVRRSALRVDARKWVAAKLLPKKYGDIKATQVNVVLNMPSGFQDLLQVDAVEYIEGEK